MSPATACARTLEVVAALRTFRADAYGARRIPWVPSGRYLDGARHLLLEGNEQAARATLQAILRGLRNRGA